MAYLEFVSITEKPAPEPVTPLYVVLVNDQEPQSTRNLERAHTIRDINRFLGRNATIIETAA